MVLCSLVSLFPFLSPLFLLISLFPAFCFGARGVGNVGLVVGGVLGLSGFGSGGARLG